MIFDLVMTTIEVYNLSYFNCKINHIKFNFFSMVLLPIFCIFMTFFFNYYILDNFLLLLVLLFVNFLVPSYMNKKINIYFFLIPTILVVLLIFSNTVSLVITAMYFGIEPRDILANQDCMIVLCLLSRIIYISLSYMFYKMEKRLNVNTKKVLQNNFWISFCVIATTFLGLHTILYEAVFYDFIDHVTIYEMLIMFIILGISFIIFFIRMQKEFIHLMDVNDKLTRIQYQEENNKKIKKLSYEIYFEKHRMYYILLNIKHLIMNNQISSSIDFIDQKINQFNNFYFCQSSKHVTFNRYILDYINDMRKTGYDIKFMMTADNNGLLDNEEVAYTIKKYLKYFLKKLEDNKAIDILIYEKNQYLIIKMNTLSQLNLEDINKDCDIQFLRKVNVKYQNEITELNLLFENSN